MSNLYNGPVVDTHHHLFALNDLTYNWLSGPNQIAKHPFLHDKLDNIRKPYYMEHLKEDAANHNVVKFVHVQCEASDALAEAKFLESVTASHPELAGIIPYANLADPKIDEQLAALAALPHVKGIRQLLNWHPTIEHLRDTPIEHAAVDEAWINNYALLAKHGLHYEFHGFSTQLSSAVKLASRYPDIPLIVNHMGLLYDQNDEGFKHWQGAIIELSQVPNISIKLSGVIMINHSWTQDSMDKMIHHVVDAFGPDRCMFGSNFPIEKAVVDYDTQINAVKQSIYKYSAEEQKQIMHDNAVKFYRL